MSRRDSSTPPVRISRAPCCWSPAEGWSEWWRWNRRNRQCEVLRSSQRVSPSLIHGVPGRTPRLVMDGTILEHDPEKWVPVFGKDHAPPKGRVSKVRIISTLSIGLVLRRRTDVGYSRHRHT